MVIFHTLEIILIFSTSVGSRPQTNKIEEIKEFETVTARYTTGVTVPSFTTQQDRTESLEEVQLETEETKAIEDFSTLLPFSSYSTERNNILNKLLSILKEFSENPHEATTEYFRIDEETESPNVEIKTTLEKLTTSDTLTSNLNFFDGNLEFNTTTSLAEDQNVVSSEISDEYTTITSFPVVYELESDISEENNGHDTFSVFSLIDEENNDETISNHLFIETEATPTSAFLQQHETMGESLLETLNERETDILQNTITDIRHKPAVLEDNLEPIDLKIVTQPGNTVVFRQGIVLGLSCSAFSKADQNIEYSWTKNGKFIDTESNRIFRESTLNGNLIILDATSQDVGLYQCVAANKEGVVFSRVVKVKQIPSTSSRGKGRSLNFDNVVFVNPENEEKETEQGSLKLHIVTPSGLI